MDELKEEFQKPKNQLTLEIMTHLATVKSLVADLYGEYANMSLSEFNKLYEDRLKEKRNIFTSMVNAAKSSPPGNKKDNPG